MEAKVRYTRVGDRHIAYQTVGHGPPDVVLMPEGMSHLEVQWAESAFVRTVERLASFCRVIMLDRSGTGLSDPVPIGETLPLEEWTADILGVCDAIAAEHPSIVAAGGAGPAAIHFAATHPERCDALVLLGTTARVTRTDDYDIGLEDEIALLAVPLTRDWWGTGRFFEVFSPGSQRDGPLVEWFGRLERNAASPGVAIRLQQATLATDVRHLLPLISARTCVIHREEDLAIPASHSQHLAEHIDGARLVTLRGSSHLLFGGEPAEWLDEVQELLTGGRTAGDARRTFATVLFTDIVDSTPMASELGDADWTAVLHRHDELSAEAVPAYGGTLVQRTGDGMLATFANPSDAIRCARQLRDRLNHHGVSIRAGIHAGEVEIRGADIAGIVVHTAARVEAAAGTDEILLSRTVAELIAGSGHHTELAGDYDLKGVPGTWQLHRVV